MFLTLDQTKADLLHAASVLAAQGCLPATDGNFSARLPERTVLITRRGVEKRDLTESDLIEVVLDDEAPSAASTEWNLHRELYLARADVGCVLHVHSPGLAVFAAKQSCPDLSLLIEAEMTLGGFALIPYCEPGTVSLGKAAVRHGGTAGVLILARHGAVAVGANVRETLHRLERAEFLARVQIAAGL